jgi:hypothetical protein
MIFGTVMPAPPTLCRGLHPDATSGASTRTKHPRLEAIEANTRTLRRSHQPAMARRVSTPLEF